MLAGVVAAAAFLRLYRLDVLPLGFHHDEALDALSALEIWTKGQHPIFFPQQGSREPLMIYLESFGILAMGATRLGARVAQASVGTASVVAAWFLFRDMFPPPRRRVAVMATACMAISFWHVFESRLGLRAISQPLFETLCLWFVWRTMSKARWPDAVLAGVFLGLTLYTYTASRAAPLLLVALAMWQAAARPASVRRVWPRLLAVAAAGVAVFAPLGMYAIRHPAEFFGRSLQVNVLSPQPFTGSAEAGGVGAAVLRTLGMFSVLGDPEWKYNIGGQPVFDWPMSALFYGGLILALVRTVQFWRRRRSSKVCCCPYAFGVLWLAVMLLPGFLSSEAPHFLRTIGIIPAVFLFPALALDWAMTRWRWTLPAGALLLAAEGVQTGYRYFEVWAHAPDAYYAMQADAADVAGYLGRLPRPEPALFSSEYPGHPTLNFLAPREFPAIRWFNGRESLPFPPPGRPELFVFTAHYRPLFADLSRFFSPAELVTEGRDPAGGVAYQIYRASPAAPSPPAIVRARLGDLAQLDGAAAPATAARGETLEVQEYWHALKPGTPDIRAFLHLVDAQGHVWAQADSLGYYAEDWRPGDAVVNSQSLAVPAYAPPLPMTLLFGLYSAASGQQLPIRDQEGRPAGTQLPLGSVSIEPGAKPNAGWRPPHSMDRALAPGLSLVGYDLPRTSARAGERLEVDLFWKVGAAPDPPPLHVGAGEQWRETGLADMLPPRQWPAGILEDRRELTVPAAARAGTVEVSIAGFKLASLTISEPPRQFSLPAMDRVVDVPVGDFATLAGYTLEAVQPGRPLRVTLVWQDRAPINVSYKVFVHLLDGAGKVVAQKDDLPQGGSMPTTLWVPDQVIVDRYEVPLDGPPPSGAQLEIGMYEPRSGRRVSLGSGDHLLLPLNR